MRHSTNALDGHPRIPKDYHTNQVASRFACTCTRAGDGRGMHWFLARRINKKSASAGARELLYNKETADVKKGFDGARLAGLRCCGHHPSTRCPGNIGGPSRCEDHTYSMGEQQQGTAMGGAPIQVQDRDVISRVLLLRPLPGGLPGGFWNRLHNVTISKELKAIPHEHAAYVLTI